MAKTSILSLPPELVAEIAEHCDDDSLLQLRLVNKNIAASTETCMLRPGIRISKFSSPFARACKMRCKLHSIQSYAMRCGLLMFCIVLFLERLSTTSSSRPVITTGLRTMTVS